VDVDPVARTVTGNDGSVTPYDLLLLATGSSAFMPRIEGLDRDGVFVFRTIDDTRALLERCAPGRKAVVIGGGLLGLEAARGLQVQGCDVTVVHLMSTLMERQLDRDGGNYLLGKMEELGVKVLLGQTTTAILGNGRVEGVALSDDTCIEADLVVVAAGIRPNAELGLRAGLKVNRGIVVNDHMETSEPDIFAVGECVEHRGVCYGLVAPLYEQGKVLAATITGHKGPTYEGTVQAAKLKIMGVDVFSAGDWSEQNAEPVRFEDRALGIYKKLTVRDGKLVGAILVGDTSDSHRYMEWLRTERGPHEAAAPPAVPAACGRRRTRHRGDGGERDGLRLRRRDEGHDHRGHHEKGINTLSQLKECTRASTGCGSCTGLCQDLLRAVAPDFEDEKKKVICGCVPFGEDKLREILRSQRLKSVQEVLEIYGNGVGCEVCKPRSATCSTCCGAAITTRIDRRASSTIACTRTSRRTAPSPSCRACGAA
jgi:nitrite reductase (NADH) large subunit